MKRALIALFSLSMIVAGCSETTVSSGPKDSSGKVDLGITTISAADHVFLAYKTKTAMVVYDTVLSTYRTFSLPANNYTAAFVSPVPDSVRFNSVKLTQLGDPTSTSYNLDGSQWSFNGGSYSFQTYGSNPYSVSVTAPASDITLTAPSNSDSVDNSSGYTVTWNSDTDGCTIYIVISPLAGGADVEVETNDDGTHTFASGTMSNLSSGLHTVTIRKGKYTTGTSGGKTYASAIFAQQTVGVIVY